MYKFRNSFLISKKKIDTFHNFTLTKWNSLFISYAKSLPIRKYKNYIIIGWSWRSNIDHEINHDKIVIQNENDYLNFFEDYNGRFVLLTKNNLIFTDATTSFSLYFSEGYISNNLSLMSDKLNLRTKYKPVIKRNTIFPPYTSIKGIYKLFPGQFYDIEKNRAISINCFLIPKYSRIRLKERVIELLTNSAFQLKMMLGMNYRIALTGGTDSRLTLLSFLRHERKIIKTYTHLKPFFFNSLNDVFIPYLISRTINLDHKFTYKRKMKTSYNDIRQHCEKLSYDIAPGTEMQYFMCGNLSQIKEEFLITSYFEFGRLFYLRYKDSLSFNDLKKKGFFVSSNHFEIYERHVHTIATHIDKTDALFFIKNSLEVSEGSEFLDYSFNPLRSCNSLLLLRLLYSVPRKSRENGFFHKSLLEDLSFYPLSKIPCNFLKGNFISRIKNFVLLEFLSRNLR